MGCIQSRPRKPKLPDAPTAEEIEAAKLFAQREAEVRKKAGLTEEEDGEESQKLLRRDTAVLKQASVFDRLHEDAMKDPSYRDLKVVKGEYSSKLLAGFERKEQEAQEKPQLVEVEGQDIRNSKLYGRLREFEEMDEKVKAEPKLEKSFLQRERESERRIGEAWANAESRSVASRGSAADIVAGA